MHGSIQIEIKALAQKSPFNYPFENPLNGYRVESYTNIEKFIGNFTVQIESAYKGIIIYT